MTGDLDTSEGTFETGLQKSLISNKTTGNLNLIQRVDTQQFVINQTIV